MSRWSRGARLVFMAALSVLTGLVVGVSADHPSSVRYVVFAGVVVGGVYFLFRSPRTAAILCIVFLPFMGLSRRLLIPVAGWSSYDPLLLAAPMTILAIAADWLFHRYVTRSEAPLRSPLFALIKPIVIIDLLEVVNPRQGGILAGFGGIFFYVVPIAWMLVSYRYINLRAVKWVLRFIVVAGFIIGLYGLKQTYWGFFPFETAWIHLGGYQSLMVGNTVRAFSTLTSAAEYAEFLGFSIVVTFVSFMKERRLFWRALSLFALPVLAYALFMESERTVLLTTSLALLAVFVTSGRKRNTMWVRGALSIPVLLLAYMYLTHISSASSLVTHQVAGLANPFNSKYSTASTHIKMMVDGIRTGFLHPLGLGLGSTTLAATKFGGSGGSAEFDVSNMFISDGFIGGLLYFAFVLRTLWTVLKWNQERSFVSLSILGILLVSLGSWGIGGNYSTTALVWLLIGWVAKSTLPSAAKVRQKRTAKPYHTRREARVPQRVRVV